MSIRATNWAMNEVRTDGPSAQSVLFVIADCANPDGIARHADPDYIAERTRQSRATVFRRLAELEAFGVLSRSSEILPDGRRRYEVCLALERQFNYDGKEVMERRAGLAHDGEESPAPSHPVPAEPVDPGSQIETGGGSQIETATVSPVRLLGSHSCDYISPTRILKEDSSPQSPPLPKSGQESGLAKEASADQPNDLAEVEFQKQLSLLRTTYPEPSNRPGAVGEGLRRLAAADRAKVQRGAEGARAVRGKNPRKPLVDLSRFVADPLLWAEYAPFAPPPPPEFVVLEPGTLAWRVCALMREIAGVPANTGVPLRVRAPTPDPTQMAQAVELDRARWVVIEARSGQFMAWGALIERWTGRWPEAQRIYLDADGNPVPRDQAAMVPFNVPGRLAQMVPKWRSGLCVPCPWPPRKDGTLAREGPPGPGGSGSSLMTEADYAEL